MCKVIHACEEAMAARRHDGVAFFLREARDHAQSHAHYRCIRIVGLQGAVPVTHLNIGGTKADAIAARIVHQLCGRIKSHRPAVEQTGDEGCRLMAAQP